MIDLTSMWKLISVFSLIVLRLADLTIDLNAAELEYLADHLLPEECRKLVAAAHVKTYQEPNNLNQAERKVPNEIPCFELLLHWNGASNEGKGESHTLLEHRLRQIGREDLANWLGKTVFKELGKDVDESLKTGLKDMGNITSMEEVSEEMPTFQPNEETDVTLWTPFDSICYALIVVILATTVFLCIYGFCLRYRRRKQGTRLHRGNKYERVEEASDNESEGKFDIRDHKLETSD